MPWDIFERAASRYEAWYATPRGQRADAAERALLRWLLAGFPTARRALEVGCGTGHFTAWRANRGLWVVGLDRAPGMLLQVRQHRPDIPIILGNAHGLPMHGGHRDGRAHDRNGGGRMKMPPRWIWLTVIGLMIPSGVAITYDRGRS